MIEQTVRNHGNKSIGMVEQSNSRQSTTASKERKVRKKRQRLSCFECRKRKLYCDRNLPCQRCVKSGRTAECSYELGARPPPAMEQERKNSDQIRNLEAEVTQLKRLLSELRSTTHQNGDLKLQNAESSVTTTPPASSDKRCHAPQFMPEDSAVSTVPELVNGLQFSPGFPMRDQIEAGRDTGCVVKAEISDPRIRFPRGYYTRHTLLQFFSEIPGFFPFIRETAREWFEPLGVPLAKKLWTQQDGGMAASPKSAESLESLLPPKDDADTLVSFYLELVEQVHRIVHIPTFRKEYDHFWEPGQTRYPAMTVLILSMASISACLAPRSSGDISISSQYQASPAYWISACEEWLRHQSSKHRRLIHYQIGCLLYLAKRVNLIRKKAWWKDTGSLVQDAIMDGLHSENVSTADRPYSREMRRRIWTTIRELDLQNAFEFGLPTFLCSIEPGAEAPSNVNDGNLDDVSDGVPTPKALVEYTSVSYQVHSHRSWSLRLEISRRLYSTELSKPLLYDDVLRYTNELTHEITAIPSWEGADTSRGDDSKPSAVAQAFLHLQLQVCILALHRPFLQRNDGRYWLSQNIYYHTSRDMLVMNRKLRSLGLQSLTAIREDVFLASLSLARVTILQPKGSMSAIMTDSEFTINLLEQCLPFEEERYLRCFSEEPWCFLTMCGAIMMVKIHLGQESRQTAKAACARKFLDLYYKHTGRQRTSLQVQQPSTASESQSHSDGHNPSTSGWLDCNFSELDFEDFDPDLSLHSAWDDWDSLLQTDSQTQSVGFWTNS